MTKPKEDAGKPQLWRGLLASFPLACVEIARLTEIGARKYEWGGWLDQEDGIPRYTDAMLRHLVASEQFDPGTGMNHDVHVAWNALCRLELILMEHEDNLLAFEDAHRHGAFEPPAHD